jgi:hypothetical protein
MAKKCTFECGTMLYDFDESVRKYKERDGTLHTKERCQEIKAQGGGSSKFENDPILGKPNYAAELKAVHDRLDEIVKILNGLKGQVSLDVQGNE